MDISQFLPAFVSFVAVLALVPPARKLAIHYGFVDEPGGRKTHKNAVPPIGGLVVFPVYMVCVLCFGGSFAALWPLFLALVLILVLGALDDYLHVNAWVKFTVQFLCAGIVVVAGHAQILHLGDLFGFGRVWLGVISIPFSIVAVVLLINAVNLMDGLDGLAGGTGFAALLWILIACILAHEGQEIAAFAPLMGALAGFLVYNIRHPFRERASIFLGDAGSMALGLTLAWFCIDLAQRPGPIVMPPISIAWILALSIIDTCAQFNRRVREGKHPFSADRGHFHHHFIAAKISVRRTTPMIVLISFILGGIGVLGAHYHISQPVLAFTWTALLFWHMTVSQKPDTYVGFFERFSEK